MEERARGGEFSILFQDEGRFGRISYLRSCWAPGSVRPKVHRQVVRESTYAYAAVAPLEAHMVAMIARKCNTENFDQFIRKVAENYAGRRVVMFLDGAGWHKAKRLNIPENMRLEFLPPYTPECNPVEHVWDEVREKNFANRLFHALEDVEVCLETGLHDLGKDSKRLASLTKFSWLEG